MPTPHHDFTFHPPVIAHRGARHAAPENTLAAFAAACAEGATWVETDVKLTSDGVPILMHDDTLERTTNGHGLVATTSWADIAQLEAYRANGTDKSNPASIPCLADALKFAIDHYLHLNLEIKPCAGRTQATTMVTLIEIAKHWPTDTPPPLISSFEPEALMIAAQLHPDWPRGLLLDTWRDDWDKLAHTTQADTINLNADILTRERVEILRTGKRPILAYTVNDKNRAKELLHWGVSAVFSDNPREIIRFL